MLIARLAGASGESCWSFAEVVCTTMHFVLWLLIFCAKFNMLFAALGYTVLAALASISVSACEPAGTTKSTSSPL